TPADMNDGATEYTCNISSFDVTYNENLTGELPWNDTPPDVNRVAYWKDCHKNQPPRPIRELRPEIPKWLASVIMQCLEKDPADRIPSSEQLLRRLKPPMPL